MSSATGVFWLPAYHDMGLIGGVLTPLYMGGRSVLMSPTAFLQRPMRWLEAIHEYKATISGAPNFAYDFVARRTKPEERAKLDLSMWRLAFCGAEPIRAETFALFAEAMRPCGFQSKSLYPCYGLAESTLLAAGPDFHHEPTVLVVNRHALSEHRVAIGVRRAGGDDAAARRLRPGDAGSHAAARRSRDELGLRAGRSRRDSDSRSVGGAAATGIAPRKRPKSSARACRAARAASCGPAISASCTTASCTSPAGSRT